MSLILDGNGPITGATTIGSPTATTLTATTLTFSNSSSQTQAAGLGTNGQTWQNLTGSRALSTTYTNSTGYPIMIAVSSILGAGSFSFMNVSINGGTAFPFAGDASPSGQTWLAGTIIIPNGATYNVTSAGSLNTWWELR